MLYQLTIGSAPRRSIAATLLAATLLVALFASVSELRDAQAQPQAGQGVLLHPPGGFVGWVGEARSVQDLFNAVPELTSVWALEAGFGAWLEARRWQSPVQREVTVVTPGMGLYVSFSGARAVFWPFAHRSPAVGSVELHEGQNLVSWGGRDAATLADAVRGIGRSLVAAYVWKPAQRAWCSHDPGRRDTCVVNRGDVIWVNVFRDVNWLQPTDVRPNIQFLGYITQNVRATVRDDLDAVMRFFASKFGIQADPSQFTIRVAADLPSLLDTAPDAQTRNRYQSQWAKADGWIAVLDDENPQQEFVVKADEWREDHRQAIGLYEGRYVLAHEYAHIVQFQLLGRRVHHVEHPQWLIEGGAWWMGWLLWIEDDRNRNRSEILIIAAEEFAKRNNAQPPVPPLHALEIRNAAHTHDLYRTGAWAVELAVEASGDEAVIEYWRQAGAAIFWDGVNPPQKWYIPFEQAFGFSTPTFYEQFRRWRNAATVSGRVP